MLVSDRAQGLENLLPTTYYTVGSKMYIIRTGIKYHLSRQFVPLLHHDLGQI